MSAEQGLGNELLKAYHEALGSVCEQDRRLGSNFLTAQQDRTRVYEEAWSGTDDRGTAERIGDAFAIICGDSFLASDGSRLLVEIMHGAVHGTTALLLATPEVEGEDLEFLDEDEDEDEASLAEDEEFQFASTARRADMRYAKWKQKLAGEGVDPTDVDRLLRAFHLGNHGEFESVKQDLDRKYSQPGPRRQAGCLIILAVPVLLATGSAILKGLSLP